VGHRRSQPGEEKEKLVAVTREAEREERKCKAKKEKEGRKEEK
jgi:hypothetical protein